MHWTESAQQMIGSTCCASYRYTPSTAESAFYGCMKPQIRAVLHSKTTDFCGLKLFSMCVDGWLQKQSCVSAAYAATHQAELTPWLSLLSTEARKLREKLPQHPGKLLGVVLGLSPTA